MKYDSIINKVSSALVILNEYETHVPDIYNAFTKSYLHYYQANQKFTEIVGRYRTLKELYLLFNNNLDLEFDTLKLHYDSALHYFSEYETRRAAFDIGYNQQLEIDEIIVYRLDGLSVDINYLQERIPIWNYASWVDNVRAYIGHTITTLRNQLAKEERLINQKLGRINEEYSRDNFEPLTVDKELLFNLRKYDLQSVIEPLFLYKQSKHALLYKTLLSQDAEKDSLDIDRKLIHYGQLINSIVRSDTILSTINSRNTFSAFRKFDGFITNFYSGISGINNFVTNEKRTHSAQLDDYVTKIKELSYEKFADKSADTKVRYKNLEYTVSANTIAEDTTIDINPITTHVRQAIDGSQYFGGVKRDKQSNLIKSFIGKLDHNGRIKWINEFIIQMDSDVGDTHTRIAMLEVMGGGCAVVFHGKHAETNAALNMMLVYDENGKEKSRSGFEIDSYPRTLNYVERTNTFIITFKGSDRTENIETMSLMSIANYNVLGDILWSDTKAFSGNIVDLDITDSGFIVVGNFIEAENKGQKIRNSHQGVSTILYSWNRVGRYKGELVISTQKPFYTSKVYKVSDHCINLYGSTGEFDQNLNLEMDPNRQTHFIVNKDLQILTKNIDF